MSTTAYVDRPWEISPKWRRLNDAFVRYDATALPGVGPTVATIGVGGAGAPALGWASRDGAGLRGPASRTPATSTATIDPASAGSAFAVAPTSRSDGRRAPLRSI